MRRLRARFLDARRVCALHQTHILLIRRTVDVVCLFDTFSHDHDHVLQDVTAP